MKRFLKLLCIIGGVIVLLKIAQLIADCVYESYGKRYITTDTVE